MAGIYRGLPERRQLLTDAVTRWLHLPAAILLGAFVMTAAHAADRASFVTPAYAPPQSLQHGILLAFALFGLLLYLATRDKSPALFGLFMALALLHFVCADTGYGAPGTGETRGLTIGTASLGIAAGALFVLTWLRVSTALSLKTWLAGAVLAGVDLIAAILALSGLHGAAIVLATPASAALLLLLYVAAWRLAIRGVREARYGVLGLSVLMAGALATWLLSFEVVTAAPLNLWAAQIATAVSAPLFAFGLVECRHTQDAQALRLEQETREAAQREARRLEALLAVSNETLAAAERKIDEMAIIDESTGAFNRRHFTQTSAGMLARRNRDDPFAMCVFQVDDLQPFGERYGHPARDQALRDVSGAIRSELRRSGDYLFRLGDDAFGVLFTASTPGRARQFAQRLRASVASLRLPHADNPAGVVTARFGVAWWSVNTVDDLSTAQIDAEVDKLLQDIAVDGRDDVVMHHA